jgi:hypothetical protein
VRNCGLHQNLGFVIMTKPQEYMCTDENNDSKWACSPKQICVIKSLDSNQIKYNVITDNENYYHNWFVNIESMLCLASADYNLFAATYFVGFFFGLMLFTMPDQIGRKGTMKLVMPLYLVACYFTVYG